MTGGIWIPSRLAGTIEILTLSATLSKAIPSIYGQKSCRYEHSRQQKNTGGDQVLRTNALGYRRQTSRHGLIIRVQTRRAVADLPEVRQ